MVVLVTRTSEVVVLLLMVLPFKGYYTELFGYAVTQIKKIEACGGAQVGEQIPMSQPGSSWLEQSRRANPFGFLFGLGLHLMVRQ